jgi:hypothetical protein
MFHCLATNVLQLGEVGDFYHKCSVLYKISIEELPLNLAQNPPFCQAAVGGSFIWV